MLAFVTGTVALAVLAHRLGPLVAHLPVRHRAVACHGAVGFHIGTGCTRRCAHGLVVWPLAWIVHWWTLPVRKQRAATCHRTVRQRVRHALVQARAHRVRLALIAWVSWEASEWVGQWFAEGTVGMACARRGPPLATWCWQRAARAWSGGHGACMLTSTRSAPHCDRSVPGRRFVLVNVVSPGSAARCPYVPLANPLDFTLIAATVRAVRVDARHRMLDETDAWRWLGVCSVRAGQRDRVPHRCTNAGVPWRWSAAICARRRCRSPTLTLMGRDGVGRCVIAKQRVRWRPLWMAARCCWPSSSASSSCSILRRCRAVPASSRFSASACCCWDRVIAPLPPRCDAIPTYAGRKARWHCLLDSSRDFVT